MKKSPLGFSALSKPKTWALSKCHQRLNQLTRLGANVQWIHAYADWNFSDSKP